jgi:hypothetical protein
MSSGNSMSLPSCVRNMFFPKTLTGALLKRTAGGAAEVAGGAVEGAGIGAAARVGGGAAGRLVVRIFAEIAHPSSLRRLGVLCVFVVIFFSANMNHRDKEKTQVAQRSV